MSHHTGPPVAQGKGLSMNIGSTEHWTLPVPDNTSDSNSYSGGQYYSGYPISCNHATNKQTEPKTKHLLVSENNTLARLYSWNWSPDGASGQLCRHVTQSPLWHLVYPVHCLEGWKLLLRGVQAQVPHIESTTVLGTRGKLRKFPGWCYKARDSSGPGWSRGLAFLG